MTKVLDILSNTFYWDWHTGIETGIPESFRIVDELFYLFAVRGCGKWRRRQTHTTLPYRAYILLSSLSW